MSEFFELLTALNSLGFLCSFGSPNSEVKIQRTTQSQVGVLGLVGLVV